MTKKNAELIYSAELVIQFSTLKRGKFKNGKFKNTKN